MATTQKKSPIRGNTDVEYTLAIKQNNPRRIQTLIKHKIKPPKGSLIYAYDLGYKELLPLLLDAGASPNDVNYKDWPIMGDCILDTEVSVLKLLLARGANPNHRPGLIVLAARVGNIEVFRLLVESGANLFQDARLAPTALFEAIARGHFEIVHYLVEQGVSCKTKKPLGKSAVEWAAEHGTPEMQDLIRRLKNSSKQTKTN